MYSEGESRPEISGNKIDSPTVSEIIATVKYVIAGFVSAVTAALTLAAGEMMLLMLLLQLRKRIFILICCVVKMRE